MDEENKTPDQEQTSGAPATEAGAADAAREAARDFVGEAGKDAQAIKNMGVMGFFSFDKFYFPIFVRYLFLALIVLTVLGFFAACIGGVVAMVKVGVLQGLMSIALAFIFTVLGIVFYRFFFETILLGFKINENLEKIRDKIQ